MPSNHLILCCPLFLQLSIFPTMRVFSNEWALCIRWPKYQSFSFSISPPVNIQGWFPLGLTGLISLQSKGFSRVFTNTTVQEHQLFGAQLSLWSNSHPYMTTGKIIALTIWTLVGKVISLLFSTPSRFVIASFSSKEQASFHSVLQSLSAVILDTKKIKSVTASTFSPSSCHGVMGPEFFEGNSLWSRQLRMML